MIGMSFAELAALIDGKLLNRTRADDKFQGVSIDSRTLRSGELFFAIRGPRHDGHDFIEQAIAHRAGGIVAEMNRQQPAAASEKVAVVSVRDSHVALLKLAESVRRISRARFVAITGSNGKTTTKELAYTLISAVEPSTFRSPGNLNNLFGAPLALFALPENTAVAVMELGISTPGEMTRLAGLVQPDIILITNVGPSHLEFLNSVEDVARAKLELARAAHTAPLIINADDPILVAEAAKIRPHCVTFAVDNVADFRPEAVVTSTAGASEVSLQGHRFQLPLAGRHHVSNLVASYAVFKTLGYSFGALDTRTLELGTAPMRGQVIEMNGIRFFADCYNANPDSVRASLSAYFGLTGGNRRILILGDMLELGARAVDYHREIGRTLVQYDINLAVFVGSLSKHTMDEAVANGMAKDAVKHLPDARACARAIAAWLVAGDFVFVKASRGMGLEAVLGAAAVAVEVH